MFYCPNKVAYQSIKVQSYSGCRADERPVQFTYQGSVYEVKDIPDRWYEGGQISGRPAIHYFRVRTTNDRIFLLRHHLPGEMSRFYFQGHSYYRDPVFTGTYFLSAEFVGRE